MIHRLERYNPVTREVGWSLCSLPACIMPSEPQLPKFMIVYPKSLWHILDERYTENTVYRYIASGHMLSKVTTWHSRAGESE